MQRTPPLRTKTSNAQFDLRWNVAGASKNNRRGLVLLSFAARSSPIALAKTVSRHSFRRRSCIIRTLSGLTRCLRDTRGELVRADRTKVPDCTGWRLRSQPVQEYVLRTSGRLVCCAGERQSLPTRSMLVARGRDLIGDRDPRQHELNVQVRAMDVLRSWGVSRDSADTSCFLFSNSWT